MDYITIKEAAEKWNLQPRRVQIMCKEGLIPDVKKFGQSWAIPIDAKRPADGRVKSGRYVKSK